MKEAMYKRYANQKPIVAACIGGTLGLKIYEPDKNDKYDCDYICSWYSIWHNVEEWGFINIWYTTQLLVELLSEKVL